jgi:hypothetical protein
VTAGETAARSRMQPSGNRGGALLLVVHLHTNAGVAAGFRNPCASSTRVGGPRDGRRLSRCRNTGLGACCWQPPFRHRAGARPSITRRSAGGESQDWARCPRLTPPSPSARSSAVSAQTLSELRSRTGPPRLGSGAAVSIRVICAPRPADRTSQTPASAACGNRHTLNDNHSILGPQLGTGGRRYTRFRARW